MSFAGLLTHRISIVQQVKVLDLNGDPELDDYGHEITTDEVVSDVPAAIQPKRALRMGEIALISQAGAALSDHTIFLWPAYRPDTSAAIVHDPDACPLPAPHDLPAGRYEIHGVPDAAGRGHHLEVDAHLITSSEVATA
jgi:head-tail adaptor